MDMDWEIHSKEDISNVKEDTLDQTPRDVIMDKHEAVNTKEEEEDIDVKEETLDLEDSDFEIHEETNLKEEDIDVKEETVDLEDSDLELHEETNLKEEDIDMKEESVDQRENDLETYVAKDIKVKDKVGDKHTVKVKEDNVQDFEDYIEIKEEDVFYDSLSGPNFEIDPLSLSPMKKNRVLIENHAEREEEASNDEPPPLVNDVDEVAASEFVRKMKSTFIKYSPFAVFNAVKIKICMKKLQSTLPVNAGEKMSIILCANAAADFKLRPACVIKKEHNTIPSKDIDSLPVWFAATERGEIDGIIYMQWYSKEFIPKVSEYLRKKSLPLKVLLLLDDSYSSLSKSFQKHEPNFKVVFFPPRTAALIQPLSQPEVIQEFTEAYRRCSELFRSSSTPHAEKSCVDLKNKNNSAAEKDPEISSEDSTCDADSKKRKRNQRSITYYMRK